MALLITSQHGPWRKYCSSVAVQLLCSCQLGWLPLTYCLARAAVQLFLLQSITCSGKTSHTVPSSRLLVLKGIQAHYHSFSSEACACVVCDQPHFQSLWLGYDGDNSASAASSSNPLILSPLQGELVKVYGHHPQFAIMLDPAHINYPLD